MPNLHILIHARATLQSLALVALVFSVQGCSGAPNADSNASCASDGSDARCGGDIVGTWALDSECLSIDSPFQQAECKSAIRDVSVSVQGTVKYAASAADPTTGTQDASTHYEFSATERYDSACLKALGFEGATPDACHGLEILWAGAVAVTCSQAGSSCQCDFADAQQGTDSEQFSLMEGQIQLSSSGTVDFCRTGDRLVETADTGSSHAVISLHLVMP